MKVLLLHIDSAGYWISNWEREKTIIVSYGFCKIRLDSLILTICYY